MVTLNDCQFYGPTTPAIPEVRGYCRKVTYRRIHECNYCQKRIPARTKCYRNEAGPHCSKCHRECKNESRSPVRNRDHDIMP